MTLLKSASVLKTKHIYLNNSRNIKVIITVIFFKIGLCSNLTKAIFFSNSYASQCADKVHQTVENDLSLCSVNLMSKSSWYEAWRSSFGKGMLIFIKLSSCMWVLCTRLKKELVPRKITKFFLFARATIKASQFALWVTFWFVSTLEKH